MDALQVLAPSEAQPVYEDFFNPRLLSSAPETITADISAPVVSRIANRLTSDDSSAIIRWFTNEASDTQIEYGTTTDYGKTTLLNTTLSTEHGQRLAPLKDGTLYHYRVKSRDAAGNLTVSADHTFTTPEDLTAPSITSVRATSYSSGRAVIQWRTNEASNTQIEYGTTTDYGTTTPLNTRLVKNHNQDLTQLTLGTLYHYRVKSQDAAGNLTVSEDYTFRVTTDVTPPLMSDVKATDITANSATLQWTTNEPSQSWIVYGTSATYLESRVRSSTWTTAHSQTLTGLLPNTTYYYKVKSRDAAGNYSVSSLMSFTTTGLNTAPTATLSAPLENTINQGQAFSLVMTASDAQNDTLTFSMTGAPSGATFTANEDNKSATFKWTPANDQVGSYELSLHVSDGVLTTSFSLKFTVLDVTAPAITSVASSDITPVSATITWTTIEASDTQIDYGTSATNLDLSTSLATTMTTSHSQTLTGLLQNTTYYYQVKSKDAFGNLSVSSVMNFTTSAIISNPLTATLSKPAENTLNEGQAFSLVMTTQGAQSTTLTFSMLGAPSGATFKMNQDKTSATFSWTPAYNQAGTYEFSLVVTDGINTTSVPVKFTVINKTTIPAGEIYVSTVDGDFNQTGHQVFQGSAYDESIVTYSSNMKDADGDSVSWQWSYSYEGEEKSLASGTGTVADVVMNYQTLPAGTYTLILRATSGLDSIEVIQTTEVIAGSWASYYNPPLGSNYMFLDFNGTYLQKWGGYSNVTTPTFSLDSYTGFSMAEMTSISQIFWGVIEKYSPFNVFVSLFDFFMPSAPYANKDLEFSARDAYYTSNRVLQVSIGGSGSWYGSAGGVAYVNSFTSSSSQNTVFVFPGKLGLSVNNITVAVAHEAGHSFGLRHQSKYDSTGKKITDYYAGANGKAPLMGLAYGQPRGLWWYGTSYCSTCMQDDIAILSNTLGFKADDHGNDPNSASAFSIGTQLTASGIIGQMTDLDYFQFNLANPGLVSFTLSVAKYAAMLDATIEIRDANNNLVTSKATTSTGESIVNFSLNAGVYYFVVKSNGLYGDIGQYFITATVPAGTTSVSGPQAKAATQNPNYTSSKNTSGFLAAGPEASESFQAGSVDIDFFAPHDHSLCNHDHSQDGVMTAGGQKNAAMTASGNYYATILQQNSRSSGPAPTKGKAKTNRFKKTLLLTPEIR